MRTCIGCGQVREKNKLVRIVRTPEGEIHVDLSGRANGRGAYLCPDPSCLEKAFRRKALNRAFGGTVQKDQFEEVRAELSRALEELSESKAAVSEAMEASAGEAAQKVNGKLQEREAAAPENIRKECRTTAE